MRGEEKKVCTLPPRVAKGCEPVAENKIREVGTGAWSITSAPKRVQTKKKERGGK